MISNTQIKSILLSFTLYISFYVSGQEHGKLFSKYFSPTEYNLGIQVWDIAQDANGILYFGNQSGLTEFDGINWILYPFPNSTIRTVEIAKNGYILVGGINELGYYSLNRSGNLQYFSLTSAIDSAYRDFGDVWNIEVIGEYWYFMTDKYLFRIDEKKCKTWLSSGDYFYYLYKIGNDLYIQDFGKGLYKIIGNELVLISNNEVFTNKRILSIMPYGDKLIIGTRNVGFYIFDIHSGYLFPISDLSAQAKALNEIYIKNEIYSSVFLGNDKYIVGTLNAGAFVFDSNFKIIDILDKNTCGLSHSIYYMHYASDGNLWMALENGIQKVELATPFRYWDNECGLKGSITSFFETTDRYYFSTTQGIFYLDKYNGIERHEMDRFKQVPTITEQAWKLFAIPVSGGIAKSGSNLVNHKLLAKYPIANNTLFTATSKGIYSLQHDVPKYLFDYDNIYTVYVSEFDPRLIYLGLRDGLARIAYENGLWFDHGKLSDYHQQTSSLIQDKNKDLWFSGIGNSIYRIESQYLNPAKYLNLEQIVGKTDFYDKMIGFTGTSVLRIHKVSNNVKFQSDSGYFIYDAHLKQFKKDPSVGFNFVDSSWKNEVIAELNSKYWINAIDKYKKGDKYSGDSVIFKKIYKYLISIAVRDSDNKIWVGASDGIFCYNEKYSKNYYLSYPALIRKVTIGNDSVIFHGYSFISKNSKGEKIQDYHNTIEFKHDIPYHFNSISFSYSCTSFEDDMKNEFSYKLEGYDERWSNWSTDSKKAYTNLPEGKYLFHLRARNFYGIESSEATFSFTISSPWYRTIVMYVIYFLLSTILIALIVKLYTKRLIKEKEKLENLVLIRTQEILMQNEEIKVQAENLKDANEKIQLQNEELQSQKSELIRRTEQLELSNATKNKFFRIIAHDLRSPISSFATITNYIINEYEEQGWEKVKIFLNELYKLSQTTFNLLENLLEWSSSQMGEIKFNPSVLNITGLIDENIELIYHKLEIKLIKIYSTLPPKLDAYADINMINTVIRNLLSNAVKFTGEGGKIEISYRETSEFYEILVSDTGIGISENEMEKIFRIDTNFSKPGTQNEKGSGLGLILCKDFIERNGGILKVVSIPGQGSIFSFTVKKADSVHS